MTEPRVDLTNLRLLHLTHAVVAFLFAASGPVAIILSVGAGGGLSESTIASWIFGAFFLNSLLSVAFSWRYRQPLIFLWTIPGTVLVGPALEHLSFAQVIGAYLATGALMLSLGLSGWVKRAMDAVPMQLVMAMVAGVFLRFGVDLVHAARDDFWIAAPMLIVFFALSAAPKIAKAVPPLIGALAAGAIGAWLLGTFNPATSEWRYIAEPVLVAPEFSWQAMAELAVPLAITVLVVQNGQGVAMLKAHGHEPPVNAIAAACGAGSIVTAFFGTVSTCLTGPVHAVLCSGGDKRYHYLSALTFCAFALTFGLMAPLFTRLLLATPPAFIAALAGLAMLRVLQSAFQTAFGDKFSFGSLVCFLVTVADVAVLRIGAPFWGIVLGLAASLLLERGDFRSRLVVPSCNA